VKGPAAVALALSALSAPAMAAPTTQSEACLRIAADLERFDKMRKDAVERNDNAWKAIVPFAVLARKTGSKADIEEADKQLLALRREATVEGCDAR
jgi:hypothetical protein